MRNKRSKLDLSNQAQNVILYFLIIKLQTFEKSLIYTVHIFLRIAKEYFNKGRKVCCFFSKTNNLQA